MKTALYRHFATDGRLLYVGVSLTVVNRLAQHKNGSGWFSEIASVSIEWLPSREEALVAELAAIAAEQPLYNRTGRHPGVSKNTGAKRRSDRVLATPARAEYGPLTAEEWSAASAAVERIDLVKEQVAVAVAVIQQLRRDDPKATDDEVQEAIAAALDARGLRPLPKPVKAKSEGVASVLRAR